MASVGVKRFKATLESLDDGLGWVVAWVPFDVAKVWPTMVRSRVVIEVGGERFRSSLFSASQAVVPEHRRPAWSTGETSARKAHKGAHFFVANKKMQKAAGVSGAGAVIAFAMWPDLEERKAVMAPELAAILKREKTLAKWFSASLSESAQFAMTKWMDEATTDAARQKRAGQLAERLLATMEAEVELPPLMATALRRTPKAAAGWATMTPAMRRGELMAVFSYQTVESRAKRLAKMLELAAGRAAAD